MTVHNCNDYTPPTELRTTMDIEYGYKAEAFFNENGADSVGIYVKCVYTIDHASQVQVLADHPTGKHTVPICADQGGIRGFEDQYDKVYSDIVAVLNAGTQIGYCYLKYDDIESVWTIDDCNTSE